MRRLMLMPFLLAATALGAGAGHELPARREPSRSPPAPSLDSQLPATALVGLDKWPGARDRAQAKREMRAEKQRRTWQGRKIWTRDASVEVPLKQRRGRASWGGHV